MMKIIPKPWGREEIWAHTEKYVGKKLIINPWKRLSKQYHVKKEETILVAQGVLILETGDSFNYEKKNLKPGEIFHVVPGTIHRFGAGDHEVHLIEVSTPELDDVVRIEDDYSRESVVIS
jgi:mannose-6-phosphate isomerase